LIILLLLEAVAVLVVITEAPEVVEVEAVLAVFWLAQVLLLQVAPLIPLL